VHTTDASVVTIVRVVHLLEAHPLRERGAMTLPRTRTLVLAEEVRAEAIARCIERGDLAAEVVRAPPDRALARIDELRPDVVISASDGSLLRSLRASRPDLPIVALVGDSTAEGAHALDEGATDVVVEGELEPSLLTWRLRLAIARQEAERRLREAKVVAEVASAHKSDFVSSMSHEIRTPLNTVLGMAELLGETSLDERQRGYVRTLQRASDHVLALIENVLDLGRIESGTVTLDDVGFDLYDVAESAIDLVRIHARRKKLDIGWSAAPDVPRGVRGDPRRMRQVFVNLLANAVKFTQNGSVALAIKREGPALHFSVIDTGIGVAPDKAEAIFNGFVQADDTISRRFGGVGLGLNIVKRIVEQMKGRIWVESAPRKGSTFHFVVTLPFEPGAAASQGSQAKRGGLARLVASDGARLRVLVVDDSEDNRVLLGEYLRGASVDVDFADDGDTAIEKATTQPFDAVFMDLQMPQLDGYAATRELIRRALDRGVAAPPVIALSAHVLAESFPQSLAAGCAMQLTKPIRKHTLLEALVRVTGARFVAETKAPRDEILPLLPKFFANRRNDVRVIRESIERKDWAKVGTLAHNMRGTGASYGFPEISALGDKLQAAAKRADESSLAGVADELEALLDRVEAEYAPRPKHLSIS
jgi:signal transduction histidine kinase/FixJ family two-component response regulator